MKSQQSSNLHLPNKLELEFLTIEQVLRIDQLLTDVGEFGEIHLIVRNGKLHHIVKVESKDAPMGMR